MNNFLRHVVFEISENLFDYLVLVSAAIFFLVFLNIARGQHLLQFFILLTFVIFYIIWGALHHQKDKTLQTKVVLEYILIGAIVLLLLQTLLMQ